MINSITVTNYLGESIVLELRNPEKSGFLIKGIKGLGPVNADVNITEVPSQPGGLFNSTKKKTRNVVLTLKLMDSPTIEEVRLKSYKFFPTGRDVKLLFKTDTREAYITGHIEKNEPNIFAKSEEIQVSIICEDPYFYDSTVETTVFYGAEPVFEFECENDGLEPEMEFGALENKRYNNVFYSGEADTGVRILIHAFGEVRDLKIYNISTRESMTIDSERLKSITGSGIVAGDDIIINTVVGKKYIHLLRDGKTTNILNALDRTPNWFQLTKGDNIFAFTVSYGEEDLQFSIESQIIYEGI